MSGRDGNPKHWHATRKGTTRTYHSWCAMRQRCNNPNAFKYPSYGGRGIKVCERWNNSFENFLADMGEAPEGHSIDRYPNNNGDYEPSNCRWATPKQQSANRRTFVNSSSLKTHCPHGHPYAGDNLVVSPKGYRRCRQCIVIQGAAKRAKLKAETGLTYYPHGKKR